MAAAAQSTRFRARPACLAKIADTLVRLRLINGVDRIRLLFRRDLDGRRHCGQRLFRRTGVMRHFLRPAGHVRGATPLPPGSLPRRMLHRTTPRALVTRAGPSLRGPPPQRPTGLPRAVHLALIAVAANRERPLAASTAIVAKRPLALLSHPTPHSKRSGQTRAVRA